MRLAVKNPKVKREKYQHKAGKGEVEPPVLGKREECSQLTLESLPRIIHRPHLRVVVVNLIEFNKQKREFIFQAAQMPMKPEKPIDLGFLRCNITCEYYYSES